jgi:predicted bacteriocin transport accessory protein
VEKGKGSAGKWLTVSIAVLLVASLSFCLVLLSRYNSQKTYIRELEERETLYSENYFHFNALTVDSFKEKVASGEEFIVLISRPECPNCEMLEMPFIRLTEEMGIKGKIYYLNVALLRRDNEAWTQFKDTYGFEGTPTYARFADGEQVSCVGWTYETKVIDYNTVKSWIEGQNDFFSK